MLIDQPLENASGIDFMSWSISLIFFVEDDPIINNRYIDLHFSFIDGFNGELLLLWEANLEHIFPHLRAIQFTYLGSNLTVVLSNLLIVAIYYIIFS